MQEAAFEMAFQLGRGEAEDEGIKALRPAIQIKSPNKSSMPPSKALHRDGDEIGDMSDGAGFAHAGA